MAKITNKHYARIIAVQVLYSINIDDAQDVESLIDYEISKSEYKVSKYKGFILAQISGAQENSDSIKLIISKYLKSHRTIDDIQPLLLSIFMNSFVEIFTDEKTAREIIIDEYIEVCGNFFDKKECGFLNAVLDKYVKEFQVETA